MMKITQAVIAAEGLGTRMRPLTNTLPKPMIPVLGKPLLEWHIEQFKRHGVTDFFISTYYLSEVIVNHFGDGSRYGVSIRYDIGTSLRGSGGNIKGFEPYLHDQFFYVYGDVFSLIDYSKMARTYLEKEHPIGMERVARTDAYADADVAEVDARGRLIRIHKKPHTQSYANPHRMRGSFILDTTLLPYIPTGISTNFAQDILPKVIADGKDFYAYECDEYSKGIDTLEKLKETESYLREKKITPWW